MRNLQEIIGIAAGVVLLAVTAPSVFQPLQNIVKTRTKTAITQEEQQDNFKPYTSGVSRERRVYITSTPPGLPIGIRPAIVGEEINWLTNRTTPATVRLSYSPAIQTWEIYTSRPGFEDAMRSVHYDPSVKQPLHVNCSQNVIR